MDKLYEDKKFAKALFIADTCQAFTLFDKVTTPNVMALGTSLIDESAYAHHSEFKFLVVTFWDSWLVRRMCLFTKVVIFFSHNARMEFNTKYSLGHLLLLLLSQTINTNRR